MSIPAPGSAGRPLTVGAVVLHYRFWPGIRPTLDALLSQSHPPDLVVVVDNGSGGDELQELRAAYPQLEYVEAPANLGYAAGMNLGIRRAAAAGAEAFLLLTHECIPAPDCLQRLAARLGEEPAVGAAGPLLRRLHDPGSVWSAGGGLNRDTGLPAHRGAGDEVEAWIGKPADAVDWLDGACILLRADAATAAGPLDERYFLYFEDAEYCTRLRRLGWRVECVPAALADQEASELPPYLSVRNRLGFLAATASRWRLAAEMRRLALNLGRDFLRRPGSPQKADLTERARGFLDFLLRRWGPPGRKYR